MGQYGSKVAQNSLKGIFLEKIIFDHFWTHVTPITLPSHVRYVRSTTHQCLNGALKVVDSKKMACK